jgi:predicted transcriptional regulator
VAHPRLSKFELQIMERLWTAGASSVREIQESFPERDRPAYTTVQTMVYRLEAKGALRRTRKIGNALLFEALISRDAAERRLVDELLALFGGSGGAVVARLVESGTVTDDDLRAARRVLQKSAGKDKDSRHDRK